MNIATEADGGYAVPTGHYQGIIARRDESMLATALGVRQIPGKGTTVNVPLDGEDDGEFVLAAESGDYDRDAPALGVKAMTLVKYTKKVDLTVELLRDEDSRLMAFLDDFVGRGLAKTHNSLLLTEVAANGTSLKTFAAAAAIAAGEPEDVVGYTTLDPYLDDSGSVGWVGRGSTFWDIASITGNPRMYAENPGGSRARELLGFPFYFSNKAAAVAASAKPLYFGNWNFVGMREEPGLTLIRDPYTRGGQGEILLYYMTGIVYGVLQAEAIGYAAHPSA
jgi:HK97 family phage major capsid protein